MRHDPRLLHVKAILLILSITGCGDTTTRESTGDEQEGLVNGAPGESTEERTDWLHEEWAELVSKNPVDDPMAWGIEDNTRQAAITEPVRWAVTADNFPAPGPPVASNNNVDIEIFEGRRYLAWNCANTFCERGKSDGDHLQRQRRCLMGA